MESQLFAAFLVGLLGGVHCVGMCGGIVGALTLSLRAGLARDPWRTLPYSLAYNTGRILSYTAAGALVGGVGYVAANLSGLHAIQAVLSIMAGLFMLALGLYLGGWWLGLRWLEGAGGRLWTRIAPIGRRLLPVSSPLRALALGLVWGWLPCGLVYSVLVWALSAGSAARGALLLASFGLGTLPTLLLLGAAAAHLSAFVRRPQVRWAAGTLVAGLGLLQIWRAL